MIPSLEIFHSWWKEIRVFGGEKRQTTLRNRPIQNVLMNNSLNIKARFCPEYILCKKNSRVKTGYMGFFGLSLFFAHACALMQNCSVYNQLCRIIQLQHNTAHICVRVSERGKLYAVLIDSFWCGLRGPLQWLLNGTQRKRPDSNTVPVHMHLYALHICYMFLLFLQRLQITRRRIECTFTIGNHIWFNKNAVICSGEYIYGWVYARLLHFKQSDATRKTYNSWLTENWHK